MKKLLTMLLMVVMSISLLAACGGDEKTISGTFIHSDAYSITCSEDGSFSITMNGKTEKGTYQYVSSKDGLDSYEFYVNDAEKPAYNVEATSLLENENYDLLALFEVGGNGEYYKFYSDEAWDEEVWSDYDIDGTEAEE